MPNLKQSLAIFVALLLCILFVVFPLRQNYFPFVVPLPGKETVTFFTLSQEQAEILSFQSQKNKLLLLYSATS